jgi:predicted MFS family arabinose efflux permease
MSALRARRFARGPREQFGSAQTTVTLIGALLLFEAMLYSAVTPVLPHYQHMLHASKPAIGLLVAAYPAGMVPGSLLATWLATRTGVRRTTVVGLLIFSVSIAAFGFATNIVTLDALRFVQGMACGFVWGGGLAWVIAVSPRERRGEILGTVIGAAIFGTILGPVLGIAAVALGTEIVFTTVGAIALALAFWTHEHPEPRQTEPGTHTPLRTLTRDRRIILGFWLIVLEAGTLGALGTLLPLRLSRFGASGIAIGLTFVLASVASTFIARPVGRVVDRRGAGLPLCIGLVMTAALLIVMPIPRSPFVLAALSVITLGGPLTAYTIPSMAVITDSAERAGIALAFASMMLNLAWATGETLGAPAAATLSQATSDTVPILMLSAIMLVTLIPVLRARLLKPQPRPAQASPQQPPQESRVPVGSA